MQKHIGQANANSNTAQFKICVDQNPQATSRIKAPPASEISKELVSTTHSFNYQVFSECSSTISFGFYDELLHDHAASVSSGVECIHIILLLHMLPFPKSLILLPLLQN